MSLLNLLSPADNNKEGECEEEEEGGSNSKRRRTTAVDLGNESEIVHIPRFLSLKESTEYLNFLNNHIPWTRPIVRVFGRSCLQPRDTCYVSSAGVTGYLYSGYQPHVYSWDDFPPLKNILDAVLEALPGSSFNSVLLNRYKDGNDHVGWHADDEKVYGPTPEIASVTFGCEREFLLKKKPSKTSSAAKKIEAEPPRKRLKENDHSDKHSFALKHGSLLVMRGCTQRDWVHSVPKRAKAGTERINLTFRRVL